MSSDASFRWDNTYAERLPEFYIDCAPAVFPKPQLLQFNESLAEELQLGLRGCQPEQAAEIFSGAKLPAGAQPLAQAYAGHQFGGFVPQLGDGRALLLGEVIDRGGQRRDIGLKGSGPTPFSRGGDGKAAIGPVLREYLLGEAMHALGIPTTRALAAVATGEQVYRSGPLPGAVLTRVAASHLRVGTFEFFAARRRYDQLQTLADYAIERHDPELSGKPDRYLNLLAAVADRQASLIAAWMSVGFIHGVMNTDNMTLSGETIDYGPCAFIEAYDPTAVFSSIDQGGRYAYANQPLIARWNLARFAETLLPLVNDDSPDQAVAAATEIIDDFEPRYEAFWLSRMRRKLGLTDAGDSRDHELATEWLDLLQRHAVDFTLGWRRLVDAAQGNPAPLEALFPSGEVIHSWLAKWRRRIEGQPGGNGLSSASEAMAAANPIYIPRNHLVEDALAAAEGGDLSAFEQMLEVLAAPYAERPEFAEYARPAPESFTESYQTFCGT